MSRIYGFFVRRRNKRFDAHAVPIVQVNIPVISVGNITTGGTGKTPCVQWIVRHLQQQGRKPAVILRGYKRKSRGLLVVHDGEKLLASVRQAGDEAYLHATSLNVPVVVCSSKVDAAVYAAGYLPCDVIVVDDGFQHRSLHRDIDVVVAAETPAGQLQLLPRGVLREPLANLERADVVVRVGFRVTGVHALGKVDVQVGAEGGTVGGAEGSAEGSAEVGRKLLAGATNVLPVTGIARPSRFVETVRVLTAAPALAPLTFNDHRWYTASDVRAMIESAKTCDAIIMTTEKDAVKLVAYASQFCDADVTVLVVATRAEITEGEETLRALILERVINEDRSIESIGD